MIQATLNLALGDLYSMHEYNSASSSFLSSPSFFVFAGYNICFWMKISRPFIKKSHQYKKNWKSATHHYYLKKADFNLLIRIWVRGLDYCI